ncbi:MAG: hypothetical protein U1F67_11695 [Rubrivivax sp.]
MNAGSGLPPWPYAIAYGQERRIDCDVLVLGGGIAGVWAAIAARCGVRASSFSRRRPPSAAAPAALASTTAVGGRQPRPRPCRSRRLRRHSSTTRAAAQRHLNLHPVRLGL